MRQDPRVDEIVGLARDLDVLVETVPRSMLDDQEPDVNHQGVLLETPEYPYVDLADVVEAEGNVLILDHLQDPQNLGTLLRAADATGVAGVIIPTDRSASVNPTVVNASSGAVEHLCIAQVPNLGNALEKLEASGRWIIGLDGGPDSQDLFSTDVPTPAALVVGSEGPGLSAGIRKRCQLIVSLPMLGKVESLNASTAGSIALFDLLRRGRTQAAAPIVD
jgi:23S rRNA (guanosine2251-2'-O)-methyltransferase